MLTNFFWTQFKKLSYCAIPYFLQTAKFLTYFRRTIHMKNYKIMISIK